MEKQKAQMVAILCNCCGRKNMAVKDKDGFIRVKCPQCGAISVMKRISRRRMQLEIMMPCNTMIRQRNSGTGYSTNGRSETGTI